MDRSTKALVDQLTAQIADVRETMDDIVQAYGSRYADASVVVDAKTALGDLEQACATLRRAVREWK